MKRRALIVVVVVAACGSGHGARGPAGTGGESPPSRAPGETGATAVTADPPVPTLKLPTNFVPSSYAARLAIDPALPTLHGHVEITGSVRQRSAVIWLNAKELHVTSASVRRAGTAGVTLVAAQHGDRFLALTAPAPLAVGDDYVISLDYDGVVRTNADAGAYLTTYAGQPYVVTQFEATSARLVFPCVDEPGLKTPWQLTLDVPKGLVAVSNTPELARAPLDSSHERVTFAPTKPLPSYLVAFGVGPFDVVDAGTDAHGTPLRVLAPHGEARRAAYAASVMPKVVDVLAAWTGIPFPYPKLDLLMRDGNGAMENAGLITIGLDYSLLDPNATASSKYDFLEVFGHETAHQWFGDLVTAAWWDDIWLNESFATFMEDKVVLGVDPTTHDDGKVVSRRAEAFAADSLGTARRIRQPIEDENDIHNAFDSITYPKGSSVLSMFEAHVGPTVFQNGIRAYLTQHAHGNATFADLVTALEAASGEPLAAAFSTFLQQAGIPELDTTVICEAGKPARAVIAQHRFVAAGTPPPSITSLPDPQLWRLPLCVAYERADHSRGDACAWVDQARTDVELPASACPAWVLPGAGARAYARPALTVAQATALRDHAWKLLSHDEQRTVVQAIRTGTVEGTLPVALMMSFVPRLISGDRFLLGDAVGNSSTEIADSEGLPFGLANTIADADLPAARARVRTLFAALTSHLGLVTRPRDSLDTETRRSFVLATAWLVRDPTFDRESVKLALRWQDLPEATRTWVLRFAVEASPAVAQRLYAEMLAEPRSDVRHELIGVLASIRDAKRLTAMLDALLVKLTDQHDLGAMLGGDSDAESIHVRSAWIRKNIVLLLARLSTSADEDYPPALDLLRVLELCDATTRDADAAWLTATFGALPSGARPTRNAIEAMDQCIAQRAVLAPSVHAWLTGAR